MSKVVLLAENDQISLRLLHHVLVGEGYEVLLAADAGDAMRLIHARAPDLAVIELRLPDVPGLEIGRMIKAEQRYRALPLLATAAAPAPADEVDLEDAGFAGLMARPISAARLRRQVSDLLSPPRRALSWHPEMSPPP